MTVLPLSPAINGVQRGGRNVVPLHKFTFPSSGVTVEFHKMSPTAFAAITQAITKECKALDADHPNAYPIAPTQPVNYGTKTKPDIRVEEMKGGPEYEAYLERLRLWEAWAQDELGRRVIAMIAIDYLEIDPAIVADEVERVRRALKRQGAEMPDLGFSLDAYTPEQADRLYFLFTCCMLDPQGDGQALFAFLVGRSQPREEEVATRIASFRATEQPGTGADV